MSLASALSAEGGPVHYQVCKIVQIRANLPPEDRDALDAAMANPDVTGASIARALKSEGISIAGFSIQRHRRGDCTCESV